jgi:hypothetical protein
MLALRAAGPVAVLALVASAAVAQTPPSPSPLPSPTPSPEPSPIAPEPFRFLSEVKLDFRHSRFVQTRTFTPGPRPVPRFVPTGYQRTADAGDAFELQNLALTGEGDLGLGVSAKVEVHILDLYNRNPVSSDDRVFVRNAWLRFGRKAPTLSASRDARLYVLAGIAPRFSKPEVRALESYGMWATAVGRFEMPQVQLGGRLAGPLYWRAQIAKGNPLYYRDTNVLAGDNGAIGPGTTPDARAYETGFPIFYDAKSDDLDTHGEAEWGLGLGVRHVREREQRTTGADLLGWYFHRRLSDKVPLRGTTEFGDLELLRGEGFPLPFSGRDKWEAGLNVALRHGRWRLDGQLVKQSIAELVRRGFDAELGAVFSLPGLFLVGETPVGNWIRPVIRVSIIDNKFEAPLEYPALSVDWDWRKYDLGLRFGVVRDVDLTVEYSRHDMIVPTVGTLHPDEFLVTLRVGVRP